MIIDPNLLRVIVIIVIISLLFMAFTYLVDFIRPILIAVVLIAIAYILYHFLVTGALGI
ncbi:MAG TPA: hypothetical protein VG965_05840 [Patescibacteria group bacterium]|nr:hypothetical protein [Patescibacteria group bacterium]